MDVVRVARQVKHAWFVANKRAHRRLREGKWAALTAVTPALSKIRPYRYDAQRYAGHNRGKEGHELGFLHMDPPADTSPSELPRRVFVVWTGENQMTANRVRNFNRLREVIEVPVVLITPATLQEWLVPAHPLHPAYKYLSLGHV